MDRSGVLVGVFIVFFKIQIFAAAFPLLVSFAIVGWPPRKRWQWLILGGCMAVGVALLPLANRFYVGPNVQFDLSGSVWYWQLLAKMAVGTPVESWYRVFNDVHPFPAHLPQAIGLLLVNSLGIFAIVAPLLWIFVAWRKIWQASEAISLAALVILMLMTFGMGGTGPPIMRTSSYTGHSCGYTGWLALSPQDACFQSSQFAVRNSGPEPS